MDNEIVNLKIKPNNQSMPNKFHNTKYIIDIFPNYGKTRPRFEARFGDSLKPKKNQNNSKYSKQKLAIFSF